MQADRLRRWVRSDIGALLALILVFNLWLQADGY
jgi:hypothetical protein